jgi:hypothetical protein
LKKGSCSERIRNPGTNDSLSLLRQKPNFPVHLSCAHSHPLPPPSYQSSRIAHRVALALPLYVQYIHTLPCQTPSEG